MPVNLPAAGKLRRDDWGIPLTQQCNDHDEFISLGSIRKYKSVDQSVSSATTGTTLVTCTDLVASMAASSKYILDLYVPYFALAAADLKFGFTLPSGAALSMHFDYFDAASTRSFGYLDAAPTTGFAFGGLGFNIAVHFWGSIETAGTPGDITCLMAQNAANATATVVRKGAYLKLDLVPA